MSNLCDRNLTLGIFSGSNKSVLNIEANKTITGQVGRFFNELLVPKHRRNCEMRPVQFLDMPPEQNLRNMSALHLLTNGLIDVYPFPSDISFKHDNSLEASPAIAEARYAIGQFIKPDNSEKSDFSNFILQNVHLLIILLIGYCSVIAVSFLIKLIYLRTNAVKRFKSTAFRMLFNEHDALSKQPLKLAVVLLFFNWFLFLNLNFINGSTKTEGTLVKTGDIIDSLDKLIQTNRTWVYWSLNRENPETTFKLPLFEKLTKKKVLALNNQRIREQIKVLIRDMASHFYFETEAAVFYNMAALAPYASIMNLVGFFKLLNLYGNPNVFYMRKSLDEARKQFISQRTCRSFEQGLLLNFLVKILQESKKRAGEVQIFEDLEDYVEQFAKITGIKLENLQNLFLVFFGILVLILFAFLARKRILKKIVKRTKRLAWKLLSLLNRTVERNRLAHRNR